MGYYLLDHPNPHVTADVPHWYPTRRKPIKAIVMHCTAGLEDLDLAGADNSAEGTARYAATTTRQVSWHGGSDSDTHLYLLPAGYTAFHCRDYNSSTYGWEISKRDMTWVDESPAWITATLRHAADGIRPIAHKYSIPLRRATRAELDHAVANDGPPVGFIGHAPLDPTRRTDPGDDFPWVRFLTLLQQPEEDDMQPVDLWAYKNRSMEAAHEADPKRGEFPDAYGMLVDMWRDVNALRAEVASLRAERSGS